MGAFEAIAMIGTSYVLISLYRTLSHIELRYHAVWHSSKTREKQSRKALRKTGKKPAVSTQKKREYSSKQTANRGDFCKKGNSAVLTRGIWLCLFHDW